MDYLVICSVAFFVSGLTLYSGFGLGTLLMPVFAFFFPIPMAIAATAIVHLANNLFKVVLVGKKADWNVVFRFAIPGAIAAFFGASLLNSVQDLSPFFEYSLGQKIHSITPIKLTIGFVIVFFALFETVPRFANITFAKKYLPLGGFISGFFGGLSGHQGALRSAFLIKAGLDKDAFIGTGTISAVIVDCARLFVYGFAFYSNKFAEISELKGLVGAATLTAFAGAFWGAKLIKKMTLTTLQRIVAVMLVGVGIGMIFGLL